MNVVKAFSNMKELEIRLERYDETRFLTLIAKFGLQTFKTPKQKGDMT